ncbi:hypothetical protein FRB94_008998 [Tulasnella sp. JGI-2019a]|nr:hypothetical protein FRB94_008998 [Tulasnella sp. JGI-2019a]KAG9040000.1 hypothetical protein FRB95_004472 [Tulasnella sp. JGI-2019a]
MSVKANNVRLICTWVLEWSLIPSTLSSNVLNIWTRLSLVVCRFKSLLPQTILALQSYFQLRSKQQPELTAIPSVKGHQSSAESVRSAVSSTGALSLHPRADEGEEVSIEGVAHTETVLSARKYRTLDFRTRLLHMFRDELHVKTWENRADLQHIDLDVHKVAGSLTSAVFFVSAPAVENPPHRLLLRIYPSSTELISRPKELYTLYKLSSIYRIGPRVYGTFGNGRVEEYFDSVTLTAKDMRDPDISQWIGRRMSELHCVDVGDVMMPGDGWEDRQRLVVFENIESWMITARQVIEALEKRKIPKDHPWSQVVSSFDLDRFENEWDTYRNWLNDFEAEYGESERVFAHNDAHHGNLLMLAHMLPNRSSHHKIIVVDFEFAGPNPVAWDIANHFHEWTTVYVGSDTPWLLNTTIYPTLEQRQHFYHVYLSPLPTGPSSSPNPPSQTSLSSANYIPTLQNRRAQEELDQMERQVKAWSPSSHVMWALWGLVQAKGNVMGDGLGEVGEFDHLGYTVGRAEGFRREIAELGVKC